MTDRTPDGPAVPSASVITMPRAFARYRCESSMVCCRNPVRAPVHPDEEAHLRTRLERSPSGQPLLVVLDQTVQRGDPPVWHHKHGRCVHLVEEGERAGCALQHATELAALNASCRNFPRIVNAVGDRWEVAFDLTCPTAARLLTEDPAPWSLVTRALDDYPYPPTRALAADGERVALRDRWWALFGAVREDPARLVQAMGALLASPLAPPAPDAVDPAAPIDEALGQPMSRMACFVAVDILAARRERGPDWADAGGRVFEGLQVPWTAKQAIDAASATPDLIAAFVEHGVHQLTFHSAPVERILRLAARRAMMVLRIVDAACDRVPFRTRTLFADAYSAVASVDPDLFADGT